MRSCQRMVSNYSSSFAYPSAHAHLAALTLAEHVTNLYIHEIALHHNQSAADFQPPFPEETFKSGVNMQEKISPAHIGALGSCVEATHGVLDAALSVPFAIVVTMPVIFCKTSPVPQLCPKLIPADRRPRYLRHCLPHEAVDSRQRKQAGGGNYQTQGAQH